MIRKICVITASRAEYGLLYWLMSKLKEDKRFELQIVVTGMHMMDKFGNTVKQIENDGFDINEKFEIALSSDGIADITNAMAEALKGFSNVYSILKPDIIVLLGDRYEILSAASSALIHGIPVAHIAGGELTEGAFDDAIRHSITKMSQLHFTATEEYKKRVIQLGESPECVYNVGGPGIENIINLDLLSKENLEQSLKIRFGQKNLLITYHPVTLDYDNSGKDIEELLSALENLENTSLIFTLPNADPGHEVIIKMINEFASRKPDSRFVFKSLGHLRYLSALKYVDSVVGNSSSGISEVPSFKIGTINIGNRQKGRIMAESVINCLPEKNSIISAINKLYSKDFQELLKRVKNPYDAGGSASEKIIEVLNSIDLENILVKKFFDIK